MKKNLIGLLFPIAIIVVVGWMFVQLLSGPAGTPEAFAESLTLEQATLRANESGKPVLVFATADWCGPCQRLKRTSLADSRVNATILARTEPVYLDLTDAQNDPDAAAAAQRMGVQGIPALLLLRDGQVISRKGPLSANDLVAWLESH